MLDSPPVLARQTLKISEGRQVITPLLAQQILDQAPYEGQRKFQEEHAEKWVFFIQGGTFLRDQGISFGRLNGRLYLLNGQHRLRAVVKSGKAISFDITIFECQIEQELSDHYKRFDTESLPRSTKDIIRGDSMISEEMPGQYVQRVCEAIPWIEARFKHIAKRKMPIIARIKEQRLMLAHQWEREAKLYRVLSKGITAVKTNRFYSGVTLACALVTLRFAPEEAETFWKKAIQNDGLHKGDPARCLLDTWDARGRSLTQYQKGHVAALAYNAHYRGESMHRIHIPNDVDIYLEGTPY
jgi:hypothetical protein